MRILHVFKTYLPVSQGGIERTIFELAEGAIDDGHDVEVLTVTRGAPDVPIRVGRHNVHFAELTLDVSSTPLSLNLRRRFIDLTSSRDIVHYHFPWPMADLLELTAGPPTRKIVTYHSDVVRQRYLEPIYRPIMHAFLARMDAIVATSEPYARSSRVLQEHRDKVSVIPLGIAEPHLPDPLRVAHWREAVGTRFFLFVGVLRYYKGLAYLREAAKMTGLPVVVVGEGNMRSEFETEPLPNVKLLGAVDDSDKAALLQLCRAFVFPSHLRSEAYGLSLVEAASAGRPMISCEIGTGTSFVNLHGETGLVIRPANTDDLARAMRHLATSDADAERFGRNARRRYLELFTRERMVENYDKLYSGSPLG